MCDCGSTPSCNITAITKGEKGDTGATGSMPYLVYTASLAQAGTGAPVATVVSNTLGGTVVWTRTAQGLYLATLAGVFTAGKTMVIPPSNIYDFTLDGAYNVYAAGSGSVNTCFLKTGIVNSATGVAATDDDCLFAGLTFVEIRVYP